MLPEDTKMRKSAKQPSIVEHFDLEDRDARPILYSDKAFETAALEWLIETNQVITCYLLISLVLICVQTKAHSNIQECHCIHKDAWHCVLSQSGHLASLTQTVKISDCQDVQAAAAHFAGPPRCLFFHSFIFLSTDILIRVPL